MSDVTPLSLTEEEIRQLSKEELAFVVRDWLKRMRDIGAMLRREDELEKQLTEALDEIERLKLVVVSLTDERDSAKFQNKILQTQTIPKLNREIENQRNNRNQLRSDNQNYQKKVLELQNTFTLLERKSKQVVEKILLEKDAVESRSTADQKIIDKWEDEVKRLEFELSRKVDDIGIFKKEATHHKERCRRLEGKIDDLERKLEKGEEERKNLLKNLPKSPKEKFFPKTNKEFEIQLQLCEPIIMEERLKRKILVNQLRKKESLIKEFLKKQAESDSELSDLRRQVAAINVKQCSNWPESNRKKLQEEIKSLKGQIEALTQKRDLEQEPVKKLHEQIDKWKLKYYTEKMKDEDWKKGHEDLLKECEDLKKKYKDLKKEYENVKKEYENVKKEYKDLKNECEKDLKKEYENVKTECEESKEAKVINNISVESPKTESKVETQIDKEVKFFPPITKKSARYQTLPLGEGKLMPNFKEDKLRTPDKVNQLKPRPPGTRKPEMSTSAGRKRKDGCQPGRAPR